MLELIHSLAARDSGFTRRPAVMDGDTMASVGDDPQQFIATLSLMKAVATQLAQPRTSEGLEKIGSVDEFDADPRRRPNAVTTLSASSDGIATDRDL